MPTARSKKPGGGGMSFRKSPPELVTAFQAAFPDDPRAERRQMFGYPAGFVNGHMFAGLHQESFVVRLPPAEREELLAQPGAARFEPMPGRPMHEYVVLPSAVAGRPERAAEWVRRALEYAASLPPKPAKKSAGGKGRRTAAPAAKKRRA